jgi:citrate lyase subunit beta/citryl-CoA lyase
MPATNSRALDKARTLPVDGIIIDLEDAVAADAKDAARGQLVDTLTKGGFGAREIVVRINGLDSQWWIEDLNAVAKAKPDALLVPKVTNPQQLEHVSERLIDIHADHGIRLWAMIEMPLAVLNVREIAAAAADRETRLSVLVMGTNDIAKETRTAIVPGRAPMLPWMMMCIAAARAYQIDILDGVYNDFKDGDGFAQECAQARQLGFDGKTLIHPSQIEPCNAIFSPSAEEVAEARSIIAVFDRPENKDKGVLQVDGRMVERMHADMARRTVAIADAIAGRS